ncbi:MAG TPA: S8 family serine peptidase, partial [Pyrinomonadaceae bacterium]|nr:S8 family serine peptidase [Pyrinomonadaceae bacterium]
QREAGIVQPDMQIQRTQLLEPGQITPSRQGFKEPLIIRNPQNRQQLKRMIQQVVQQTSTGSAVTEADTTHRSNAFRAVTGADGTGLKIGVLSDGVNSLAQRQASGDLPATVTVLPGQAGSGDEGTAMLEIIYDVAPGAQLYFATAFSSISSFANNIKALRTAGCDIIVDDVTYFIETPFQDGQATSVVSPSNAGIVIQAVNDVTVGSQAGAIYFSSAGNSGNKNDGTAGVWEGDFVDGGPTASPLPTGNSLHDFGGQNYNVAVSGNRTLLKWSDPLGASSNDYDLYRLSADGTTVVASSTNVQNGTQDPVEDVGTAASGQRIVIVKKASAAARYLHLNTNRGVLSISTPGVMYGHNASRNTISVAAVPAGPAIFNFGSIGPFPFQHSSTNTVETFSSDGPRRIFYNADSTPITPGNVSSTGGELLAKPDIAAADGVKTTTPGFIPFFGTSASAPQAAAMIALLKQASPSATRTQLINAMKSAAIDIEAAGNDRDSGAGIFMPIASSAALGVTGPAYIDYGGVNVSEFSGNGNGFIEAGETANVSIQLNNLGLSTALAVSAQLSTTTAGVAVVPSATRAYPNITSVSGSALPLTPFRVQLADNFPCGGSIDFTLTVNYTGGVSPQTFNFSYTAGSPINVTTVLDTTAPPASGGFTSATGTQTGRIARNAIQSTCTAPKAVPALQDTLPSRQFDSYTFTASASGCMTVKLTAANGIQLYVVAYSGSFDPSNPKLNFLADPGQSLSGTTFFSFNVTAGQTIVIVVHEISVGGGLGQTYTLNVAGPVNNQCSGFSTGSVSISGTVKLTNGRAIPGARVILSPMFGPQRYTNTNSFGFYRFDNVPGLQSYVINAKSAYLSFTPQVVFTSGNLSNVNFTSSP